MGKPSGLALQGKVDLVHSVFKLIDAKTVTQRTFPGNLPGSVRLNRAIWLTHRLGATRVSIARGH